MRILLRHPKTRKFLQEPGVWTDSEFQALAFQTSGQAIYFVAEKDLEDVELLLAFEDPRYNICLPFSAPPPGQREG